MTDVRIVLCGCASCPIRDSGFTPESYRGETLCFGPWLVVVGCPARLLGCQFSSQEAAETWSAIKVTFVCTNRRESKMRLRLAQFHFVKDGDGLKCCKPGSTKALVRIVPDQTYAGMWRVLRDGSLSDMLNITRAKDVAFGLAESMVFAGEDRDVA